MNKTPKKILEHVLKIKEKIQKIILHAKSIAWILHPVCKNPEDFGLYLKNIKKIFLTRKYIVHF